MDVFKIRDHLIEDYARYVRSFIRIRDVKIEQLVQDALKHGELRLSTLCRPKALDLVPEEAKRRLDRPVLPLLREDPQRLRVQLARAGAPRPR